MTKGRRFDSTKELKLYPNKDKIEEMLYAGTPLYKIAEAVGVHRNTLSNWIKSEPEFRKVRRDAKKIQVEKVESALLKSALGHEKSWDETRVEKDEKGKVVKKTVVTKTIYIPPSDNACKFFLSTQSAEKWNPVQEIQQTTVEVPYEELTVEERKTKLDKIKAKAKKLEESKEESEEENIDGESSELND